MYNICYDNFIAIYIWGEMSIYGLLIIAFFFFFFNLQYTFRIIFD